MWDRYYTHASFPLHAGISASLDSDSRFILSMKSPLGAHVCRYVVCREMFT